MVEAPTLEIRQPGEDLPFLWGFRLLGFLLKNDPSMMPNIWGKSKPIILETTCLGIVLL
jgi:hypothetical protein